MENNGSIYLMAIIDNSTVFASGVFTDDRYVDPDLFSLLKQEAHDRAAAYFPEGYDVTLESPTSIHIKRNENPAEPFNIGVVLFDNPDNLQAEVERLGKVLKSDPNLPQGLSYVKEPPGEIKSIVAWRKLNGLEKAG